MIDSDTTDGRGITLSQQTTERLIRKSFHLERPYYLQNCRQSRMMFDFDSGFSFSGSFHKQTWPLNGCILIQNGIIKGDLQDISFEMSASIISDLHIV